MSGEITQNEKSEIEKKLEELQKQLKQREDTITEQSKERDALKAGIKDLEKASNEIKQTTETYGKAYVGFDGDKKVLTEYHDTKRKIIDRVLENYEQEEIEKQIREVDAGITKKQEEVNTSIGKRDTASKKFEGTKKSIDDKQKDIDSLKQDLKARQKEIDDKLKYLKTLKVSIDKAHESEKFTEMYYWIKKFEDGISSLEIKNKEDFTKEFNTRLSKLLGELDTAKLQYTNDEKVFDEAKEANESLQKGLDSLISSREADIVNKISQIKLDNPPQGVNPTGQGQTNNPGVNPGNPQPPA